MSAEVSTPTASTSGGSVGQVLYPVPPHPLDLERYCGPFDLVEASLIKRIAELQVKFDQGIVDLTKKCRQRDAQKKLLEGMEQQFETLSQTPDDGLDTVEFELETEREVLDKLKKEVEKISDETSNMIDERMDLKEVLRNYLGMIPSGEGNIPELRKYPGYKKCFKFFYDRYWLSLS
ncbi:hypothetical protein BATDEDRAFT_22650 [Batrachochytrium dendrobatidis JAM81]|uniref:Uncharacterized protein n=1 Tax=Batrachochytrium dendrobatidis (strain JAM81 / FGSC 10211) TaxID=684364 RepID=F4NX57_BATDJ|nr:uncharacterized protein BATDEDRAFT_22650 [Batrachochytrium dendrobatidis JAM81]EGF82301.1 hypothetical protein BATDEDRAFT_22650 [Batrachochytrium dendrobatidis JAM81]|eukprot:XP_006676593.1 hypothetical protein BATDEDRAFT_22650 [Batrachochytrium dendrobatidis JAM81]